MAGEKRKAGAAAGERPAKKPHTGKIKVVHHAVSDAAKPIIMTSPGVALPSNLSFTAYSKKEAEGNSSLILQSSDHPTIDYVATESSTTEATEQYAKHYLGVFDPETNTLKIMEARKMTAKGIVRIPDEESDAEGEQKSTATPSSRLALTQAFGTKKSKKAVESIAENRLLARDAQADDPVSSAILDSINMGEEDDEQDMDDLDAITTSRANKPLPAVNMHTDDITEVYGLSALVFPGPYHTTLSQMQIAYWKDCVSNNKAVATTFRFIATRVGYLTARHLKDPSDTPSLQNLQLLRYIQLLAEIHRYVSQQNPRRPLPPVDKWPAKTTSDTSLSTTFKSRLLQHFFPQNTPTTTAKTLLTSTILALTLHIPSPKTSNQPPSALVAEPSEITLDLAMPAVEINKLYRELGCKFVGLTDSELSKSGWDKILPSKRMDPETGKAMKVPKPKFARLKFPIEFPKLSSGRPKAKR